MLTLLALKQHCGLGSASEATIVTLATLPIAVGARKISVMARGSLSAKRGGISIELKPSGGAVVSDIQISGFRATQSGSGGRLAATVLPFDFDVPSDGTNLAEGFISFLDVTFNVTTAGDIEVCAAASNPMAEATENDVSIIDLAVLSVE